MKEGIYANWLVPERRCNARIALESPLLGYLVGHVYRTYNAFCEGKAGAPVRTFERDTGRAGTQVLSFWGSRVCEPVHATKWPGQRLVLCLYLGMRYSTGGGCWGYPFTVDAEGYREVIKGAKIQNGFLITTTSRARRFTRRGGRPHRVERLRNKINTASLNSLSALFHTGTNEAK